MKKIYLYLGGILSLLAVGSFLAGKALGFQTTSLKKKVIVPVTPMKERPAESFFEYSHWRCVSWTKAPPDFDLTWITMDLHGQDEARIDNLPIGEGGMRATLIDDEFSSSGFRWKLLSPEQSKTKYWVIAVDDYHFRVLRRNDKRILQYVVDGDVENSVFFLPRGYHKPDPKSEGQSE